MDEDEVFEMKSSGEKKQFKTPEKSGKVRKIFTSPDLDDLDIIENSQSPKKKKYVNNYETKTSSDEGNLSITGPRKANFNKKTVKKLCILSDTESDLE